MSRRATYPNLRTGAEVLALIGTQSIPGVVIDRTQFFVKVRLTDGTTRRPPHASLTVTKLAPPPDRITSDRDQSARRFAHHAYG